MIGSYIFVVVMLLNIVMKLSLLSDPSAHCCLDDQPHVCQCGGAVATVFLLPPMGTQTLCF